jgi:hypothetical protein
LIYTDSLYVIADTANELYQIAANLKLGVDPVNNTIRLPNPRCYRQVMEYGAIPITPRELAAMSDNRLHTGSLGDPDTAPAIMALRREGE